MTAKSTLLSQLDHLLVQVGDFSAATDRKVAELRKVINSMPDDKPVHVGRWKPELGDTFFMSGVRKDAPFLADKWNGSPVDEGCYALGDVFQTSDAAAREFDRRLVHVELQDLADAAWAESGKVLDWGNGAPKYCFLYDHSVGQICLDQWRRSQAPNTVYFPSEASYRAAIEKIGAERFEKYCKGV